MVEVENLTRYYGDYAAIQGVTFQANAGEILGFLGPNAAGKTTTMRVLAGFLPPTSGTARIAGYDVEHDGLETRRRIGYLPEHVPLYEDMTVRGYLTFCANLRGVSRSKVKERVAYVLNASRSEEYADTIISKLSRGYRQRVGIAQALVHDPDLLILDEPTVGLDPRQIVEIRQLIRDLRGSHTVILSTHILPEVQTLCDRVVIIHEGRVAAIDTPQALTDRLQGGHEVRLEVRGDAETALKIVRHVEGVREARTQDGEDGFVQVTALTDASTDAREALAAAVVQAGLGLRELRSVVMTLEEIFMQLTQTATDEPLSQQLDLPEPHTPDNPDQQELPVDKERET